MNSSATAAYRTLLFVIAICVIAPAASYGQMANTQRPNKYVPWVSWETAMDQAPNSRRPVMVLFNGSDWNTEAREFTMSILATHEFAGWSSRNVIKVEIDFPRFREMDPQLKQLNEQLRARYQDHVNSVPTILFLDEFGNVMGKLEYQQGSPDQWIKRAREVMRSIRLPDLVA
ncbi:MAG: hypothetical protein AAF456_17500 [Planctomycetota bacterium]